MIESHKLDVLSIHRHVPLRREPHLRLAWAARQHKSRIVLLRQAFAVLFHSRSEETGDLTHALGDIREWLVVLQGKPVEVLEQLEHDLPGLVGIRYGRFKLQPGAFQFGIAKGLGIQCLVIQAFGQLPEDLRSQIFGDLPMLIDLAEGLGNLGKLVVEKKEDFPFNGVRQDQIVDLGRVALTDKRQAEKELAREKVKELMDQLTPPEAEVVRMKVEGHTAESAALALGIPQTTFDWRYSL